MGRNGSVMATGRSTAVLAWNSGPSMSTEWTILRKIKRRWKSDPLKVLGARESRVQGEAAGQVELLV